MIFCVSPNATVPTKSKSNAGFDLYSQTIYSPIVLKHGESHIFNTGVRTSFSDDKYFSIRERGSTGIKCIKVNAGVVDSNYRGEIMISIVNASKNVIVFTPNSNYTYKRTIWCKVVDRLLSRTVIVYPLDKAIAQGILEKYSNEETEVISLEEYSKIDSDRGEGRYGSTGK